MASTEYRALRKAWDDAVRELGRTESEYADVDEQIAYDALIDYVESHGLNYTALDPRDLDL